MDMSKLPESVIPSFEVTNLGRIESSQSVGFDSSDDDAMSLKTQLTENSSPGRYYNDWFFVGETRPSVTSTKTTNMSKDPPPKEATDSTQDLLEPTPARERMDTATNKARLEISVTPSPPPRRRSKRKKADLVETSAGIRPGSPMTIEGFDAPLTPLPSRRITRSCCRSVAASPSPSATSLPSRKRSNCGVPVASRKRTEPFTTGQSIDLESKTAEGFGIPVHTLILGTHPSTRSLHDEKYYANPMNAFWWIAGDCLGFRRDHGVKANGEPYKFTSHLRYGAMHILPYHRQLQELCGKGFALKNTIQSCKRIGSSDRHIQRGEVPNDIRKWCQDRPSIRRIVFSNGKAGFDMFAKHFKDWLESGELVPGPDEASQEAFHKHGVSVLLDAPTADRTIECIVAVAVSPANAMYSFEQKRSFWEVHVFEPGLEDFREWENSVGNS